VKITLKEKTKSEKHCISTSIFHSGMTDFQSGRLPRNHGRTSVSWKNVLPQQKQIPWVTIF